jgi:RNA polymerase sigma-70 factor, ECF subfamily
MVQAPLHEKILTDGLKEGNIKIFDYLFHYYYSGLVVFSCQYVDDMNLAEDIVQDFFFYLWLNHEKIEINQSLKSYFFSAVRNRSFDCLKHKKIKDKFENKVINSSSGILEEENFLVESELEERINEAIEKLPDKCKRIFQMNRFEGIKPAEIAKQENISVRTVEGHIGKAIKILRTELKPYLSSFFNVFIVLL